MELVLSIIAGFGLLLLLISYLAYALAGFKHHFVTGLISALPVLNIVTLPALWHKAGKKFILGVLGLILFGSSWFFGANKGLSKLYYQATGKANTRLVASNPAQNSVNNGSAVKLSLSQKNTLNTSSANKTLVSMPFSNQTQRTLDEDELGILPNKALYKLAFDSIPVDKITTLKGRIIRVTTDKNTFEGKVLDVNASSVLIQSGGSNSIEQELPIAYIKQLQLMIKKAQ